MEELNEKFKLSAEMTTKIDAEKKRMEEKLRDLEQARTDLLTKVAKTSSIGPSN